jgi:hypothetical protein
VDLAADRRDSDPARLSIGPVLAETDAVATKVATVFSRGEARDYLDLAGILATGRYTRDQLMAMAAGVDPGFTPRLFADALAGVDRFPNQEFASYGVDSDHIAAVRQTMRSWSAELVDVLGATPWSRQDPERWGSNGRSDARARASPDS